MAAPVPRDRDDFHVAILCALSLEAEAINLMLDHRWKDTRYRPLAQDDSAYTLGSIGEHNVVVVHVGGIGINRAASAAQNLKFSYPGVRLVLNVGICGGMPEGKNNEEILLGDVVISKTLIQYDFGKRYPEAFERSVEVLDTPGAPNDRISNLLSKMEIEEYKKELQAKTVAILETTQQQKTLKVYHPGLEHDILYKPSYAHRHRKPGQCRTCEEPGDICGDAIKTTCEELGCEESMHVSRQRLSDPLKTQPHIHFGPMGCANTVMKSGQHRDDLSKQGIIAVEMEGAGMWRSGQSIVIKGVCDYADSHKRKNWQRYAAATAAACTKAFLLEWWEPEKQKHTSEPTCEYFDIPNTQRVKKLFGREYELTQIATHFDRARDESEPPRILVLLAMGGQGKSQIALEFCHRARKSHRGVFWVNGSSISALTQSLVNIAQKLDKSATETLPDDNDGKVKFAIRFFERWQHRWLIVFDNCDDVAVVSELRVRFLPQVGKGDILFTSRHRDLDELGDVIEIPPMPQKAGVELLLHRYHNLSINQHLSEASLIVNRLGGLALAIDQASAYIKCKRLSASELSGFIPAYNAQREKILKHTTRNFWRYTKIDDSTQREAAIGAFTTWELSFQHFVRDEPDPDRTAHFLTLMAFFGQLPVSEAMFTNHWDMSELPPTWMTLFSMPISEATEHTQSRKTRASWESDHFWDTIYQAFQMSLLESIARDTNGASLTLHPLIRDWLQLRLATTERQIYTREAISILSSFIHFHDTAGSHADIKAITSLHMDAVLACDAEFFPDKSGLGYDISTCSDASSFASFYADVGQYDASFQLYEIVKATRTKNLGAKHPDTLDSMNGLATVLSAQGKYGEAELRLRQILEVRERVPGAEHPDTLGSRSNLATVLSNQSKYGEAEQMFRQILEVRKRVPGAEHPDTLKSMNDLASVLGYQEKYGEAEQIHREGLEVRKRVLGAEHLATLRSINNLATLLNNQGRYVEAEQMYRQVIEAIKRVQGAKHPETLGIMENFATLLHRQSKNDEAEQMLRQVLGETERVQGANHPHTLRCINNLANVLSRQSKYSEAEQMFRRACEGSKQALGAEDPTTLNRMSSLALFLCNQRKYDEAESIQVQAARSSWTRLGLEHTNTQRLLKSLLDIWRVQDRGGSRLAERLRPFGLGFGNNGVV